MDVQDQQRYDSYAVFPSFDLQRTVFNDCFWALDQRFFLGIVPVPGVEGDVLATLKRAFSFFLSTHCNRVLSSQTLSSTSTTQLANRSCFALFTDVGMSGRRGRKFVTSLRVTSDGMNWISFPCHYRFPSLPICSFLFRPTNRMEGYFSPSSAQFVRRSQVAPKRPDSSPHVSRTKFLPRPPSDDKNKFFRI